MAVEGSGQVWHDHSRLITAAAGIPAQSLAGSNTSVFAGSFCTDYSDITLKDPYLMHETYKTGNGIAMLSNRISHFYDFQGASMTLDVGCSTSLVALHQAVQTLRSGESDVAVVGSSLLCLSPDMFIAMANSRYVILCLSYWKSWRWSR